MDDLAFLTSPDMSKTQVITNHLIIAEYAGQVKFQSENSSTKTKTTLNSWEYCHLK